MKDEKPCIDIIGRERCTGCFGCKCACSTGAIEMPLDEEGFYKPVVNRAECTKCGVCQQHCPVLAYDEGRSPSNKWPEPKAFAAWTKDESLRRASSSGGMFGELARSVIDAGGSVAGCIWGPDWTPRHVLTSTWAGVGKMRGSKYVPSQVGDVYSEIINRLCQSDAPILFSGTPCQVAALEVALDQAQRERVLLAELICHGVPSLRVFHAYLKELFKGDAVVSYTFREKTFGWQSVLAESAGGRRHHLPADRDAFIRGFSVHHLYVMSSCYSCNFARIPRAGDITLGDFWGCPKELYDRRGVSVVLANTGRGLSAVECLACSGRIVLEPSDLATVVNGLPRLVTKQYYAVPSSRRAFLDGAVADQRFTTLRSLCFPEPTTSWQVWRSRFKHMPERMSVLASKVSRHLGGFDNGERNPKE
jgi:coenzyme F420-reducing hydrogenase beta subunit